MDESDDEAGCNISSFNSEAESSAADKHSSEVKLEPKVTLLPSLLGPRNGAEEPEADVDSQVAEQVGS